ncbi:MAG: hypothetical protein CVV23_05485 [Ignavibacteriae bacterium HGW-Ignavibacteriae-2]|nr:MAG: hypothetical protein CVV23_05485 [Ignavibacteriae bacterium HGW-Ignavibacteriae-2]
MNKSGSRIKGLPYVKILLPTLLTIGLLITAIFIVVIPQFENIIIDRKREMIRELTNSIVSMINKWHQMELNGELTQSDAQSSAIDQTKYLRYGAEGKDYFWITDMHPNMLVHPYRPDLNGKDLSDFSDSRKRKLFVEMAHVAKSKGEGYVDYMWQWKDDSDKIVPKVSYVKSFEPWGWVIGTGIYIEDVKQEIVVLERKIITISIIITILGSILLTYIAYQNLKSEKKRQEAEDDLKESREKYRLLVEASGDGLIMILENKQVFYNKTILSMLNYEDPLQELRLSDIFIAYPDSQIFDFDNYKKKVDLVNEQFQTKFKKQNNEILDVLINISPITFSNNKGIVISVKDISRHKEIEEALDYTKEKYLALTNHITMGVFRASPDKQVRFTEINPALVQMIEAADETELLNESLLDFFVERNDEIFFIDELNRKGVVKNKIVQLKKLSGSLFTVSLSAVIVKNSENKKLSIDGIIEDISELKKSDKEREELITDLQNSLIFLKQKISPLIKSIPEFSETDSLYNASEVLKQNNCEALIVKNDNKQIKGIITDLDIHKHLHSSHIEAETPISSIIPQQYISINSNSTLFEALNKFRENVVNRLIVINDSAEVAGVINKEDLFNATFTNYLFFIEKLKSCKNVESIIEYRQQLLLLIKAMIDNEMSISGVTNFITIISETITKRIIELTISKLGAPPAKFAFITMGSEGREEQTLLTDQDNALIYEEVLPENMKEVKEYFIRLGEHISFDLNTVGYSFCKGGIMAKNEKWCQSIDIWEKYFTSWVTTANPQDLLDSKIFFDFRFVYGNELLSERLSNHISKLMKSSSTFFVYLSENILNSELPDNFKKVKNEIDLKLLLLPVVDFARLYSLKNNIKSTNTVKRLEHLLEKGLLSETSYNNLIFCYNLLMQLRLQHQIDNYSKNLTVDNIILPQKLSEFHVLLIKKFIDQLGSLKNKIKLDFKGTLSL